MVIAAITSCTNTSNPAVMVAAGLLARNAVAKGLTRKPWVKSSLAPGSKAVELYLQEANLLPHIEQLGFGIVAVLPHGLLPYLNYRALVGDTIKTTQTVTAGLRFEF